MHKKNQPVPWHNSHAVHHVWDFTYASFRNNSNFTFKTISGQYFGFLANMSDAELRESPRLTSHASGVVLGVTHIINGLENPVIVAKI